MSWIQLLRVKFRRHHVNINMLDLIGLGFVILNSPALAAGVYGDGARAGMGFGYGNVCGICRILL